MYTPSVAMPTYRLSDTPASILKTDPETPTVEDSRQAGNAGLVLPSALRAIRAGATS